MVWWLLLKRPSIARQLNIAQHKISESEEHIKNNDNGEKEEGNELVFVCSCFSMCQKGQYFYFCFHFLTLDESRFWMKGMLELMLS